MLKVPRLNRVVMLTMAIAFASVCMFPMRAGAQGVPAGDSRGTVFIHYYPWYGTPTPGGWLGHWEQGDHLPPDDIGANFYPKLGAYDSKNQAVVNQHMAWIAQAGVKVVMVSWWGQGSREDSAIPVILDRAAAHGVKVAFNIEPYAGRTPDSLRTDVAYIYSRYGSHQAFFRTSRPTRYGPSTAQRGVFFLFDLATGTEGTWRAAVDGLRGTGNDAIIIGNTPILSADSFGRWIEGAHFDGMYVYDVQQDGHTYADINARLAGMNAIFVPSVGPGYVDGRAVAGSPALRPRAAGATYDQMWWRVFESGAEWTSNVSFNEWHEGTQIEPAVPKSIAGFTYLNYEGAYGATGVAAETAYIARTRQMADHFAVRNGPLGGTNLGVTPASASSFRLNWTGGGAQTGYWVARLGLTTGSSAVVPAGAALPAVATSYTDAATSAEPMYCHAVIPVAQLDSTTSALGISDLLCSLTGLRSATGAPSNFTIRLNQSSTASLTWARPSVAGLSAYQLLAVPFDGSPVRQRTLAASATSVTDDTGGIATCYVLLAMAGSALAGNSDAVCGVPGTADLGQSSAGMSSTGGLQTATTSLSFVRSAPSGTESADVVMERLRDSLPSTARPMVDRVRQTVTGSSDSGQTRPPTPSGTPTPTGTPRPTAQPTPTAAPTPTPGSASRPAWCIYAPQYCGGTTTTAPTPAPTARPTARPTATPTPTPQPTGTAGPVWCTWFPQYC
jgi:hypothetical protein